MKTIEDMKPDLDLQFKPHSMDFYKHDSTKQTKRVGY